MALDGDAVWPQPKRTSIPGRTVRHKQRRIKMHRRVSP
jgi:hypothetical protein